MPVLPTREEFPYAIRQVSEALGSNGSTSMGSVCASTMSLLNAGVPLKAPVAGIAMGLISEEIDGETHYVALTDILGAEDAFGDMDFKVAGTKEFVTALQLDTKLDGIPASVLAAALKQAQDARLHILDVMNEAIDAPDEMSPYAPRIITIKIPVDKIGEVIGPKGKMINQIQDDTGAEITIEDDGTIYIGATDGPKAEAARATINAIANPTDARGRRALPRHGRQDHHLRRVRLAAARARTACCTSRSCASSPAASASRTSRTCVKVGDKVQVEIAEIDSRGKLSLIPVIEGEDATTSNEGRRRQVDVDAAPRRRPAPPRRRGPSPVPTPCITGHERHRHRPPHRPPRRAARRHRDHADRPLGDLRHLGGVGSRDETPGPERRLALPGAPAVQGHPTRARWTSPPRSTRSAAR